MKIFWLTVVMSIGLFFSIHSQTINGKFLTIGNTDTSYTVKLQLCVQQTNAILGNAAIRFTYDTNSVYFPQVPKENKDYCIYNLSDSNYVYSVSHPSSNTISINIASLKGTGIAITKNCLNIAEINFKKLTPSYPLKIQSALIQFFSPNSNIEWSTGTWTDSNSVSLPVELSNWTASVNGNNVNLNWKTATEINNYGFKIQRKDSLANSEWQSIGFVQGSGNSSSPKQYSFIDRSNLKPGNYFYRLVQVDNDGSIKYSNSIKINIVLPHKYNLFQNYPNPFNPTTTISYTLPYNSQIKLIIYNILGQKVTKLVDQIQNAGHHNIVWNANNLSSGIYIYVLSAKATDFKQNYYQIKKMVLMK
jgi:hypothetical protein